MVELSHGSWRSLKAHLTGGLGELFALIWLAQRKAPEGEVWSLRRRFKHGRALITPVFGKVAIKR
jgi:hypothetical protein